MVVNRWERERESDRMRVGGSECVCWWRQKELKWEWGRATGEIWRDLERKLCGGDLWGRWGVCGSRNIFVLLLLLLFLFWALHIVSPLTTSRLLLVSDESLSEQGTKWMHTLPTCFWKRRSLCHLLHFRLEDPISRVIVGKRFYRKLPRKLITISN